MKVDFAKRARGVIPSKLRDQELPGRTIHGERGNTFLLSAPVGESVLTPSFLAFDQQGRPVVVKLFRPEVVDELDRERVLEHHRGLCRIVEAGGAPRLRAPLDQGVLPGSKVGAIELPPTVFTATRWVAGHSLAELRDADRISLRETIPVLETTVHTLEALSSEGELHRNLKLSNVFVGDGGATTLADALPFHLTGLANGTFLLGPSPEATFAAPELNAGVHGSTALADVFGFAHLVFQLLTGRCAWDARNPIGDSIRTAMTKPHALTSALDRLPSDFNDTRMLEPLDTVLARALGPRETRPSSVRELWEAVRPLLGRALAPPTLQAGAWPPAHSTGSRTSLFERLRDPIRAVSFSARTGTVVALTHQRLFAARLDGEVGYREQQSGRELPTGELDLTAACGVLCHPEGPIVWGVRSAAQLTSSGVLRERVPPGRPQWRRGVLDGDRAFLLGIGDSPPSAVVFDVDTGRRASAWASPALNSVAQLSNDALLGCGDYGALVLFRGDPERIGW
ncbi:MAG: hypothetical protein JNK04_10750, partial [Myxococcales bacterium]|nr:hypothetical protein [Myxococcales bacterium]